MTEQQPLIRAIGINAAFSGFSALVMFTAGGWLADQLGLRSAAPIYAVAGFLTLFALQLSNIVRTRKIRTWEIVAIIGGDLGWVVASVILVALYYQSISVAGLVLVDIVALAVLAFAILQIRGLRRLLGATGG